MCKISSEFRWYKADKRLTVIQRWTEKALDCSVYNPNLLVYNKSMEDRYEFNKRVRWSFLLVNENWDEMEAMRPTLKLIMMFKARMINTYA